MSKSKSPRRARRTQDAQQYWMGKVRHAAAIAELASGSSTWTIDCRLCTAFGQKDALCSEPRESVSELCRQLGFHCFQDSDTKTLDRAKLKPIVLSAQRRKLCTRVRVRWSRFLRPVRRQVRAAERATTLVEAKESWAARECLCGGSYRRHGLRGGLSFATHT